MMPAPEPQHQKQLGGSPIRRKRKLVSAGGQKWFKGSPRKSRPLTQRHQRHHSSSSNHHHHTASGGGQQGQLEGASPPPLPSMLVQFTFVGGPDLRLSVYDQITLVAKEDEAEIPTKKKKKSVRDDGGEGGLTSHLTSKGQGLFPLTEERPLPLPLFHEIEEYTLQPAPPLPNAYIRWMDDVELGEEVEYHVDEEDSAWLDLINHGREGGVGLEVMELIMDRLEKESYLQMQSSGLDQRPVIDDDAVCCICMDGECQNSNAILFCDMCNLAVHQECYGVPYIPEGQWLCRRCLQSPSRQVECVLCPNKGGAFKQTDDGRWAHVVCAIWIPEVCFANTVFLEPVDSVNNIPPARWRLCCFICKYKGRGACIQCHKSNCYTAFHVTCAQHAGLCMRMDTVRVGSTVTVRKTAYCDNHAPSDFIRNREGESSPTVRQKLKACRKMLAEKRSAKPTVSIPTIPPDRVSEIASSVSFARKNNFIKRLLSYWKLKRIQRNGVPLLRRLQAASNHPPSGNHHRPLPHDPNSAPSQSDHAWKFLTRLRQDLERARLLCELIRKREKQKRELVAIKTAEWDFRGTPFVQFLLSILDEIGGRDGQGIFAEPVDPTAVPDYESVIHSPMDLSTMRVKASQLYYDSIFEMKIDFQLMIDNCLLYNAKDTIFHRAGLRLAEAGRMIFKEAERMEAVIGFDSESGLHLDKAPTNLGFGGDSPGPSGSRDLFGSGLSQRQNDELIFEEMDAFMKSEDRAALPYPEHIAQLQELLDKVVTAGHPGARKKRYERLYREIQRIRRLENPTPKSPRSPKRDPPSPKHSVSSSSPPHPGRKLRRKSLLEQNDDAKEEEAEEVKSRPPKRRVVQEMEAKINSTPNRRSSRSTEGSPTHPGHSPAAATPTRHTPLRRTTRLSLDSETGPKQYPTRVTRTQAGVTGSSSHPPVTPVRVFTSHPKPSLSNGLMRNGRNKNYSAGGRRSRNLAAAVASEPFPPRPGVHPIVDSFSVYRETENQSSDGEEQEEEDDGEEDEQEEEEDPTEEDSSTDDEDDTDSDEDHDSDSSEDIAPTRRSRRGGDRTRDISPPQLFSHLRKPHRPLRSYEDPRPRRDSSPSSTSSSAPSTSSSSSTELPPLEDLSHIPLPIIPIILNPMQLVWAFYDGAWAPGLIIDPDDPYFQSPTSRSSAPGPLGFSSDKNGFSNIPFPPEDVLARRPPPGRKRIGKGWFLVLNFNKNSTWDWFKHIDLQPLGVSPALDNLHLRNSALDKKRKWVRKAYEKSLLYRSAELMKHFEGCKDLTPPEPRPRQQQQTSSRAQQDSA